MECKFASEGLQAIDGDDDMLTAMTRELVENKGIGESADRVWRSANCALRRRQRSVKNLRRWPGERPVIDALAMLPISIESVPEPALLEAANSSRRSTRRDTSVGQLSLF